MRKFLLSFLLVFLTGMLQAQTWSWTNTITAANPSASNPYTTGDVMTPANTAIISGIGRNAGLTPIVRVGGYDASNWGNDMATLDVSTDYFSFTTTPNNGLTIFFTNFIYTGYATGTGPVGVTLRCSIDNFTTDLGLGAAVGTNITLDLTDDAFLQGITEPVEFRLYGYGATDKTNGEFSVDQFQFNGEYYLAPIGIPIVYYDFDNGVGRPNFEGTVDQEAVAGTSTAFGEAATGAATAYKSTQGETVNRAGAGFDKYDYVGGQVNGKSIGYASRQSSTAANTPAGAGTTDPATYGANTPIWYIKFKVNTEGFKGINLNFNTYPNNASAPYYGVQYSTDNTNWNTVGSVTNPGLDMYQWNYVFPLGGLWGDCITFLPSGADNQTNLYIRIYFYYSGSTNANAHLRIDNITVFAKQTLPNKVFSTLNEVTLLHSCAPTTTETPSGSIWYRYNFKDTGVNTIMNIASTFALAGPLKVEDGATINFKNPVTNAVTSFIGQGSIILNGPNSPTAGCATTSIGISSPNGIKATYLAADNVAGTLGNLGNSGLRTLSSAANYTYFGTAAQVTGDGLPGATSPTAITGKLVINNSAGVSLSRTTYASGELHLQAGNLLLNDRTLVLGGTIPTVAGYTGKLYGSLLSNLTMNGTGNIGTVSFNTGGQMLNNITLNRTSTGYATLASDLTVNGSMILTNGVLNAGNNTLTYQTGNSPLIGVNGTLTLGSAANLIFGTTGNKGGNAFVIPDNIFTTAPNINSLAINRTNSLEMNNQGMYLTGALTLNDGIITTTASKKLTLAASIPAVGGASPGPGGTSFINGPLIKEFTAAGTEFSYPVGTITPSAQYQPIGLLPASVPALSSFTAQYFAANPDGNFGGAFTGYFVGTSLISLLDNKYWTIDRTGAAATGRVVIPYLSSYTFNTTTPTTGSDVAVAKYTGTNPSGSWDFTGPTSGFNMVGPQYESFPYTSNGKVYSAVINSFSPFSIGHWTNIVLPTKLLAFDASLQHMNDGFLQWKVADLSNLSSFELQYSQSGQTFSKLVDMIPNTGANYSYLHRSLLSGNHYYRLVIKEKSGKTSLSAVKVLVVGKAQTAIIGLASTLNDDGSISPIIYSAGNQSVQSIVTNAMGKRIAFEKGTLHAGPNQWRLGTQVQSPGTYFVTIQTDDGVSGTFKFVKQ